MHERKKPSPPQLYTSTHVFLFFFSLIFSRQMSGGSEENATNANEEERANEPSAPLRGVHIVCVKLLFYRCLIDSGIFHPAKESHELKNNSPRRPRALRSTQWRVLNYCAVENGSFLSITFSGERATFSKIRLRPTVTRYCNLISRFAASECARRWPLASE